TPPMRPLPRQNLKAAHDRTPRRPCCTDGSPGIPFKLRYSPTPPPAPLTAKCQFCRDRPVKPVLSPRVPRNKIIGVHAGTYLHRDADGDAYIDIDGGIHDERTTPGTKARGARQAGDTRGETPRGSDPFPGAGTRESKGRHGGRRNPVPYHG